MNNTVSPGGNRHDHSYHFGNAGVVCALRYWNFNGRRIEVLRATIPPAPANQEDAAAQSIITYRFAEGGPEHSITLKQFGEAKPVSVRAPDFETHVVQHNVLLMLWGAPPILDNTQDVEWREELKLSYNEGAPVEDSALGNFTNVESALDAQWENETILEKKTRAEIFHAELIKLHLPADLERVVRAYCPSEAPAMPLPDTPGDVRRGRAK